jgi:hypothetical protein
MAQLTFPVMKSGLAVPVWIGLNGDTTDALLAAGQVPVPIQARGLLDTGSDVTAVAAWILQQLGITPTSTTSTHTAAGNVPVKIYSVSLGITDPNQPVRTWLTHSTLQVTELNALLPDTDVLIGLDVLLECKLLLDGPAPQFTLEF